MAERLVIVESPAKAKTINKFLGRGYVVKASMGHVRDLPKRKLGVDEETFEPTYAVLQEKKKTLAELKSAAKSAKAVYLASDPDREGEAICWHLREELQKETDASFHRVMFNEITKRAILEAFEHPRDIDLHKVEAQQARRILDRLVGYKISPLLWDKVRRGLSAGRVQSVALRIICEREREIQKFEPKEYWSLNADLAAALPPPFQARLVTKGGKKIDLVSRAEVEAVLADAGFRVTAERPSSEGGPLMLAVEPNAASAQPPFRVEAVQAREKKKNPLPPFITSKLQQDAARQLGFGVSKTMRLAQGLYEGKRDRRPGTVGLITYMRTDSTRVSDEAIGAVREYIGKTYGTESIPDQPRTYRVGSLAQEAHEAIRPTSLDFPPSMVQEWLGRDELRLYTLIWNRFVASQMALGGVRRHARGHRLPVPWGSALPAPCCGFRAGSPCTTRPRTRTPRPSRARARTTRRATKTGACPQLREGQTLDAARAPAAPALHPAAAAVHRGHAGQGARGERHRPPVDLCHDPVHDRGSRLRREGQEAVPSDRARVPGQRPDRRIVRRHRRRRLHGADGAGARRHRGRPDATGSTRCASSRTSSPRISSARRSRCATSSARRSRPIRCATSAGSRWSSSGAGSASSSPAPVTPNASNTRDLAPANGADVEDRSQVPAAAKAATPADAEPGRDRGRAVREVRKADGATARTVRPVPRLLRLSRVQNDAQGHGHPRGQGRGQGRRAARRDVPPLQLAAGDQAGPVR